MTTHPLSTLPELQRAVRERFGFADFKPGQAEVIGHIMAGRSAAAVFATGAGKSLCYQLPATLLPGLTVVVSPLVALMRDQIAALRPRGIVAHSLDSSLAFDAYKAAIDDVGSGAARLLYVAPERFNNERFRRELEGVGISLFAVDEAHCISEWGHNFRPDYLKLAVYAKRFGAERVLALTATATAPVLADICRTLDIASECAVRTSFYRSNLFLQTTAVLASERDDRLLSRFRDRAPGSAIVYVTLQRTAEEVATLLQRGGIPARPYHAGLEADERAATQAWFTASRDAVVVATIAFGMGIDKADIRYVYHYNLPKSLENFSQEIGRAGRDGEPSTCEVLACTDDLVVLENFAYGDTPTLDAVTRLLVHVFSLGDRFDVSLTTLARDFDMRALVLRTLLTYLELSGHIAAGTPYFETYELKPLMSSAQMLVQIDAADRGFVKAVLARSKKAKVWFRVDVDEASAVLRVERGAVVGVLDMLAQRQMLELRSKGVRHRFERRAPPGNVADLAHELHTRAVQREANEVARLRDVLALIARDGCQVCALGAHFCEPLSTPCGHCSWCVSRRPAALPGGHGDPVDERVWIRAAALRAAHPRVLNEPRTMARLLCGISSPALTKARLGKHELFGAQSGVPFAQILARASASVPRSQS